MKTPDERAHILRSIEQVITAAPFQEWLPTEFVGLSLDGVVEIKAHWRESWGNGGDGNYTHGGVIATLSDLAAECAVMVITGAPVPTIDMSIRYLGASRGEDLLARGSVIRSGRSIAVAEARIFRQDGTLIAVATAGFAAFRLAETSSVPAPSAYKIGGAGR